MSSSREPLRIALHIDVTPGVAGGIAQSTQGLVQSLGVLDGPESYLLVADTAEQADWVRAFAGSNQQVLLRPQKRWYEHTLVSDRPASGLRRTLQPLVGALRHAVGRISPPQHWPEVTISDGYYESLGCDVLHFPTQWFSLCAIPTIFNPHDLQHLHYPQFFSAAELARREVIYRAACRLSNTVVVGSRWIKDDVVRQFGVDPQKVQIIPWASPSFQYPEVDPAQMQEARTRLGLPETYAFYPAVTWPHKNHLRLLDALADLRDRRGIVVNLVCTGSRFPSHWPKVERKLKERNLEPQVRFLGFVSESDLRAVYRLAQFLVIPTLFEADSCPVHEAWFEGIPVASSNHTAMPDQVGEAGLLFDAKDVGAIADAVARMTADAALRAEFVARGRRRVSDFTWERTARAYRAVYRRAANLTLDDEDRWLLQWDWMREPQRRPATTN